MTGFNTQVGDGVYRLQFETDIRQNYEAVQAVARACLDGRVVVSKSEITTPTGWISVKDRLPECWVPVIVHMRHKHTPDDGYSDIRIIMRSEEYGWARLDKHYEITHWMPLPEPPKEE